MISISNTFRCLLAVAIVVASASMVVGPAVAQSDQPDWADELYSDLQPMVGVYNAEVDASDAGIAGDQLKGETVNLVVTAANGSQASASFRMDSELKIRDLAQGTRDDATMKMTTDRATMERIIESETPASSFQNALQNGDITIDGLGTVNAVKWVVINLLAGIFG